MEKKRILYVENNSTDFRDLKKFLEASDFIVFPENSDWGSSTELFVNYLSHPTSENEKKIIEYLISINPDLIILDVGLGGAGNRGGNSGLFGDKLHTDIILNHNRLRKIPIIYLTGIRESWELPTTINKITGYVHKNRTSSGYDKTATYMKIFDLINRFLFPHNSIRNKLDDNF